MNNKYIIQEEEWFTRLIIDNYSYCYRLKFTHVYVYEWNGKVVQMILILI